MLQSQLNHARRSSGHKNDKNWQVSGEVCFEDKKFHFPAEVIFKCHETAHQTETGHRTSQWFHIHRVWKTTSTQNSCAVNLCANIRSSSHLTTSHLHSQLRKSQTKHHKHRLKSEPTNLLYAASVTVSTTLYSWKGLPNDRSGQGLLLKPELSLLTWKKWNINELDSAERAAIFK